MTSPWTNASLAFDVWKYLHGVELTNSSGSFMLNALCCYQICSKFWSRFDRNVTILLLHAILLLGMIAIYGITKAMVMLFFPLDTSSVTSFIVSMFASIPYQMSPIRSVFNVVL